jgi:hypothetical protein
MKPLTRTQTGLSIGAVVAFLFGGGGSLVVWGADQRYAQKADIDALATVVETNSKAQLATVSSVDILLVQVLDIRIDEIETEIRALEAEETLTNAEQGLLAERRREIEDLRTERTLSLNRVLERRSQ